jgi:hypothetical protein
MAAELVGYQSMWDFEISYAERYSKDKQLSSIERF